MSPGLRSLVLLLPCAGFAGSLLLAKPLQMLGKAQPIAAILLDAQSSATSPGTPNPKRDSNAAKEQPWLSNLKELSEALKNLVTVGGIVAGGLWTWSLFIKKREKFPRADLSHSLTHRLLGNGYRLLHLDVKVSNTGEGLLSFVSGRAWVQQILPPPQELMEALRKSQDPIKKGDTQYLWPLLAARETDWQRAPIELEPGESNQIVYDFLVDREAETIEIYTYFKNAQKTKREIGWHLTTLCDLNIDTQSTQTASADLNGSVTKETDK